MASRFWGGASSSDEESDHSSGEEDVKVPSRFAKGGAAEPESSDEEESFEQVKRVVKSARDKRFEELAAILSRVKNHLKINDWNSVVEEYEKLNKQLDKAKQIVAKEGVPRVFIKTLVVLEDAVKRTQENKGSIKMNAPNTKSYNAMRQKIKKGNKNYEKQIDEYRKNPDADEDDEREEKEESSESEPEPEPESESSEEEKPAKGSDEEDDSDEEYQEQEASRSKWFTAQKSGAKPLESKDDKDRDRRTPKQKEGTKKVKTEKEGEANKPVEMNEEQVKAKLKEILAERGKKKTDASKQSTRFAELLPFAKTPELEVEILIHLISSQFDMNRSVATALPVTAWKSALENVKKVLTILEANPNVILQEHDVISSDAGAGNAANSANTGGEGAADVDEQKQVSGNLMAFIERLDDEYIKSLQNIDPHTKDYIQRLQDEVPFLQVADQTQAYYETHGKFTQAARIAERHIEHLYFRQDNKEKRSEVEPAMARLTEVVYAHGDDRLKIRTLLCNIFFSALLDKFYEARDMMLQSHLQDSISHTDILTQILFNRTMVQLGLCAFRLGLIKQAHSCLSEICAGGRVKELLAQGTNTRFHDRNPEQEKEERRRQLPYHMHINQDVLDAVHYICAMLLEVPNMAAHAFDVKKKLISRPFRRLLEAFEKSVFNGPPENTRDVIVHAAKGLEAGNWKLCQELVFNLPIWALLPTADKLKEMLSQKIKEEGLRTYLFAFNTLYESISLEHLVTVFELDKNAIHSIVSKMMISEELHASWDQPTDSIIMHQVEPTRLQYLAMQLAEKAAVFVENNEKLLDAKTGSYGYNKSDQDQKQQKGGQRGGPGGRQPYNKQQGQGNKQHSGGHQQQGTHRGGKQGGGRGGMMGGNNSGNSNNSQQNKNKSGGSGGSGGNRQQQQQRNNKGGQSSRPRGGRN